MLPTTDASHTKMKTPLDGEFIQHLNATDRALLAIFCALPEPVLHQEISGILQRIDWDSDEINAGMATLDGWWESGVLEKAGNGVELARPLRVRLRGNAAEGDLLFEQGCRLLFDALENAHCDVPLVVVRHGADFAANANRPDRLFGYLDQPVNYENMASAGSPILAIPSWCHAVSRLDAGGRLTDGDRLRLLKPVLSDVLHELEHQYYAMVRLFPVVKPLVDLLSKERDETLFDLFDSHVNPMQPLPEVPGAIRGVLAIIQLFGEANAFERQLQLARKAIAQHQHFDVYHFAAIAANHWGRYMPGVEGEALLTEALKHESDALHLTRASRAASYPLRHTTFAMANFGLGQIARRRGEQAEEYFNRALDHINERRRNGQVLGYKAQIQLALGRQTDAWAAASESVGKQFTGTDAGEVLLRTASSDVLHECFTPYTKLQAVCCSLAHGPFVNEAHRGRVTAEAVIPFLIRERVWPMAVALDRAQSEATQPGIAASCQAAHRGRTCITCRVGCDVIEGYVDVWRWDADGDGSRVVLGIEELGVYARARSVELALSNLGHVIAQLSRGRPHLRERVRPIDVRISAWVAARVIEEPSNASRRVHDITQYYYRGRQEEAWAGLQSLERTFHLLPAASHREYQRLRAWVGAEVGERDALQFAHDLFEYQAPSLAILTDLQKAGAARGFTPHPIVESAHELVEARGLAENENFFAPIERLYFSMYLLSVGCNADAEAMLVEALESEMRGPGQARVIARIADMLTEALRRRGELDLARRMIEENIEKREAEGICIAPSLVQSAKCAQREDSARIDMARAIDLYGECNRKERIRAMILEARMISVPETQNAIHELVVDEAKRIPALSDDRNLQHVFANWASWCRPSFCPELDYWNL